MTRSTVENKPPKVFISYSHVPPEHAERVRSIAQRLADDGADVEMDIWSVREGHDINAFMERMTTDGTVGKVLIFSNKSYAAKADARTRGVGVEAQILSAEIYGKAQQEKFVPIVCEYDESGSACLPTFLKGRLYIDFSTAEAEAENYERLVRRIFDKPEHNKPAIGTPPAYITAAALPANPLAVKLRTYRDALLGGRTARFILDDFLERFLEMLAANKIHDDGAEPFDEVLVRSLEATKSARDDFLELIDVWIRSSDADLFVPKIVQVLEQIRALGDWPEGVQVWHDDDGANFRFLAHELLLSVVAILLRHREFKKMAELLHTRFVLPDSQSPRRKAAGAFPLFYEYASILRQRNERLQLRRLNLQADFLRNRATTRVAPFVWLQQADLICFVCSLLVHTDEHLWYPHTLLYARLVSEGFETFLRAESLAFYTELSRVWNEWAPDAFRSNFAARIEEGRTQRWEFDYRQPNWNSWLNLEKLGTRP